MTLDDDGRRILSLFRRGSDTYAIGTLMNMDEWLVEKYLHAAMTVERMGENAKKTETKNQH